MEIAVVILNYNGKNFLEKFLPTVIKYSDEASIYVADNQSTDNSVIYLEQNFPLLKILINKENGGFAKGYNDALKEICADFYVLLNSDVKVTENWIAPCIELMKKNDNIWAVQPKILSYQYKNKFEHAGAAGGFLDRDYFPFCQGRIFDFTEEDNEQYNEEKEIFWASGACMFIRAKEFHSFGGFDEDFFAHMEEIDLCWRMKLKGGKIYFCPNSKVYHVGGGTLNYMHPKKTFLNFRNSLFMITKNYQGNLLILFFKIIKRMLIDGLAATLFLLKFQFKHFWAVFIAHLHFYKYLSKNLKKRKMIQQNVSEFNRKGLYPKSIIFQKYFKGIRTFGELGDF